MKRLKWYVLVTVSLLTTSVLTYLAQIHIFNNKEDTYFYMLQDLGFLPIQILLVTIIITEWLNRREKQMLLAKMNMVIGVFFSEVGTSLISTFVKLDPHLDDALKVINANKNLSDKEFNNLKKFFKSYSYTIDKCSNLTELKSFLIDKRPFLLRLLENQNLLEHESFTELLFAVFHLTEELAHRESLSNLKEKDYAHLHGDIKRVYVLLISEWLCYIKHLKETYPYIFSLIIRINPFDKNATAEIK